MTDHAAILAALRDHGGHIVYSVELDEHGRNVGSVRKGERLSDGINRRRTCSGCGSETHDRKRCNGPGKAPRAMAPRRP
jgi:hypothetical protein